MVSRRLVESSSSGSGVLMRGSSRQHQREQAHVLQLARVIQFLAQPLADFFDRLG